MLIKILLSDDFFNEFKSLKTKINNVLSIKYCQRWKNSVNDRVKFNYIKLPN